MAGIGDEAAAEQGEPARLSRRARLRLLAALVGWLGVAAALTPLWGSHAHLVAFVLIFAGLILFRTVAGGLQPDDYRRVDDVADRAMTSAAQLLSRALLVCLSILVPLLGYAIARGVTEVDNVLVSVIGLAGLVAVLVVLIRRLRAEQADGPSSIPSLVAAVWLRAGSATLLAVGVFAGITWQLVRSGAVTLRPEPANAGELADFYMYYLLKAVPGDVPGTLRWAAPLEYEQARVGVLVLLFNLTVVAAVVAYVRRAIKVARTHSTGRAQPDLGPVDEGQGP